MKAAYTEASGRPWGDDDPCCQAYEEMWRAGWDSAALHIPEEAADMAEMVERKYVDQRDTQ